MRDGRRQLGGLELGRCRAGLAGQGFEVFAQGAAVGLAPGQPELMAREGLEPLDQFPR